MATTSMRPWRRPQAPARLWLALLMALPWSSHAMPGSPAERDVLMAKARQEHDAGRRIDALAHCQAVLERWPQDGEARALNVTLLTELGASTRAMELAATLPAPMPTAERARLEADHVAQLIRWAEGEPADVSHPYAEADRAVAAARRSAGDPLTSPDMRQRAELDLIVALSRAGRAEEAVARYDALQTRSVNLPAYVERPAADALLIERRPADAARVYEDSIAKDPGPYDASESDPRIGLMYAYLEGGDTAKAFRTIDALAAKEPAWIRVPGVRLPVQNQRKVDADLNAATLREYVNMPADAYARLVTLSREAPANAQIRRELGMVELARGWPRQAQDDFNIAATLDRRDVGAYIGEADASRVLNDFEEVDENLAHATNLADRNGRVDRAVQAWDRERGWQFDLSAEQGKGSSPDFGDRDRTTQATIASPLIDDHWRVLALGRYANADLPEGGVRRSRVGLGIRGYARGLEAYLQVLPAGDRYVGRAAWEAGFNWALTDHWAWATDFSSAGDDTPLRAQYYGISAKTLDTTVTWRANERLEARLGLSRDRFSDGNERTGWLATLTQRLHTAPNLALDGGLELGGSMNTQTDRPYFNPRRDRSYAATARLENTIWQFYERSVTQRIDLAVGEYAEQGYATDWMTTVHYGQVIQTRPGFNVGWGIGWHSQPYDGRREHRFVLDLTMHWGE